MQTDLAIGPVADPANQPIDEPGDQPRSLPDVPQEPGLLAPSSSSEGENALRNSSMNPPQRTMRK
ncbi:hypothetical protein PQQ51_16390 [Paraburkholderia xenovorans]